MRKILTITLIIIYVNINFAVAQNSNFSVVDKHAETVPAKYLKNTTEIASYLTKPFNSDEEKIRAIYFWVANNFKYDFSGRANKYNLEGRAIEYMLQYNKGVCQNYSELVNELCEKANIKSVIINGYTRQMGKVNPIPHAWNGVFINNKWLLIDATWASGRSINGRFINQFKDDYFLIAPEIFITNHMPFDPLWQFSKKTISNDDFYKNITIGTNQFNLDEEISKYFTESHLQQMKDSYKRIISCGLKNNAILDEVKILKENIEISEYNIGVECYNNSVNYYNNWTLVFNNDNTKTSNEIQSRDLALKEADKAYNILRNINPENNNRRANIKSMLKDIVNMKNSLNQE